jgi:glycosyltransferase involved in cell wall biosynthesis
MSAGSYCLDLSPSVEGSTGLGRYASGLAQALLDLGVPMKGFINDPRESQLPPRLRSMPILTARLPRRRWRLRAAMSYFGWPPMDRAFGDVKLFHATDHLLPKLRGVRSVFTLHDTAYLHFPEHHLPRNRIFLRVMMPRFLELADRVIAVSQQTRRDALRFYHLDPAKIHVIGEGVEARFRPDLDPRSVMEIRQRYALPERFILYVGMIQPRKNLPTLLEAYAAIRPDHPDVGLVIVGARGWLYKDVFRRLRELGLEDRVVFTGHVPDEHLPALFNAAEVFAFPSIFEGFGLPPLEAMASGVPVVCSDASSLPEVVGDAALRLPPRHVTAWVRALRRVLVDSSLRASLRRRGLDRARLFTWEATARKTLEVYQSLET